MTGSEPTDWRAVWRRKGSAVVSGYDAETLLALSGYDTGAGRLTASAFAARVALIRSKLALRPGMRLLDVGCGAGAVLWALRGTGIELYGVDYSESLVEHARAAVPEATILAAESVSLPFTADAIVCCSMFQYLPDLDYARRTVSEFMRVAPVALILDVPDALTREESEAARASLGSTPSTHLYYPRSFFEGAETWSHDTPGYGNAPYRFDALVRRVPEDSVGRP